MFSNRTKNKIQIRAAHWFVSQNLEMEKEEEIQLQLIRIMIYKNNRVLI